MTKEQKAAKAKEKAEAIKAAADAVAAARLAVIFASRSRRNTIIRLVQDNMWDTSSLAEILKTFGYSDLKANKKAIAGTLYDMAQNKGWDVRRCDNDRIFVIV